MLLGQKLEEMRPRVIAFNGKIVYEKFTGRPCKLGLQKETLYGAQRVRAAFDQRRRKRRRRSRRENPLFQKTRRLLKSLKD